MKKYLSMLLLAMLIICVVPASASAAQNPEVQLDITKIVHMGNKDSLFIAHIWRCTPAAKGYKIGVWVKVRYYTPGIIGPNGPYYKEYTKYLTAKQNELWWSGSLPYAHRVGIVGYRVWRA